jgi:hypothetical protein
VEAVVHIAANKKWQQRESCESGEDCIENAQPSGSVPPKQHEGVTTREGGHNTYEVVEALGDLLHQVHLCATGELATTNGIVHECVCIGLLASMSRKGQKGSQ